MGAAVGPPLTLVRFSKDPDDRLRLQHVRTVRVRRQGGRKAAVWEWPNHLVGLLVFSKSSRLWNLRQRIAILDKSMRKVALKHCE